jgi:O-antigen/teichoic acid export membrane protein
MSKLKSLLGQTAWYGLSSMLGRTIQFLLVPFFTKVLNLEEYGIITDLYSYAAFLNVVYLYGMETTYFRNAKNNPLDELKTYRLIQTSIVLSTLFFTGIFIFSANQIADLLRYPDKGIFIYTLACIMAIDSLVAIPFARLRQFNRAPLFAGARLLNIALNIFFNVFFLIVCPYWIKQGVKLPWFDSGDLVYYILLSNLLANAVWLPMFFSQWKEYRWRMDWAELKSMLIYGLPLMVMGLAGMVNEVLDRIVLKYWLPESFYPNWTSLEAVGVYGACYKLSMFMSLAVQSFRFAGEPFFFKNSEAKDRKPLFARVMRWFVVVCAFLFVAVSVNLFWIAPLFIRNAEMRQGLAVVPILLLANLFLGVYYNLAIWFKLSDRTYFGTWLGIGGALLTLFLNLALIPYFGFMGCAWATLICYAMMTIASYWIGQKYYPISYDIKSFFRILFFSGMLVMFSRVLPPGLAFSIGYSVLAMGLFVGAAYGEYKFERLNKR